MSTTSPKTFKHAKLYAAGNDLSKQWFVYFSVPHPITGKLKRIRIYDGFTQYSTIAERNSYGVKLITEINKKLDIGWNPVQESLSPEEALYVSEEKTLLHELFLVLEENRHNLRQKSYSTYRSHLRGFASFLEDREINNIAVAEFARENAQDFVRYLNISKKSHPTTRNSYAVTLKTLFERLIDKEL